MHSDVKRAVILIVEDDAGLREALELHFQDQNYEASGVQTLKEARRLLRRRSPDLVILDQSLPDGEGIELLHELAAEDSPPPVIFITGQEDLELAIEARRAGALEYLRKPLEVAEVDALVAKTLKTTPQRRVAVAKDTSLSSAKFVGSSPAILDVCKRVAAIAPTDAKVLITGETGTGKELVANLIHRYSNRRGPIISVNCAALVGTLFESELFGHEKGAFTDALRRRVGKVDAATDGTLFLDEIGELKLPLQAKLLRFLQDGSYSRVGSEEVRTSNARVLCATNADLGEAMASGEFRVDLLFRLNVYRIHIPPLRERREDIPLLTEYLLRRACAMHGLPPKRLSSGTRRFIANYPWPGNVRQLQNVITIAAISSGLSSAIRQEHLEVLDLPAGAERQESDPPSLEQIEAQHISRVLVLTGYNKTQACKILGISRPTLDRKLARYKLD